MPIDEIVLRESFAEQLEKGKDRIIAAINAFDSLDIMDENPRHDTPQTAYGSGVSYFLSEVCCAVSSLNAPTALEAIENSYPGGFDEVRRKFSENLAKNSNYFSQVAPQHSDFIKSSLERLDSSEINAAEAISIAMMLNNKLHNTPNKPVDPKEFYLRTIQTLIPISVGFPDTSKDPEYVARLHRALELENPGKVLKAIVLEQYDETSLGKTTSFQNEYLAGIKDAGEAFARLLESK